MLEAVAKKGHSQSELKSLRSFDSFPLVGIITRVAYIFSMYSYYTGKEFGS